MASITLKANLLNKNPGKIDLELIFHMIIQTIKILKGLDTATYHIALVLLRKMATKTRSIAGGNFGMA
jgi:hypothetical protein